MSLNKQTVAPALRHPRTAISSGQAVRITIVNSGRDRAGDGQVTSPVGRDRQHRHGPPAVPTWYRISGGFMIVFVTQQ